MTRSFLGVCKPTAETLSLPRNPKPRTFMTQPRTLYNKIWDAHLVHEAPDGTCLLYVDRHQVHEVKSPQAVEGPNPR